MCYGPHAVGGSRLPSNLSCHCGRLPPDRWRCPEVTGVNIQFSVYSSVRGDVLCY